MLWCFCLLRLGETLTKILHHNYAEVSDEILQADFCRYFTKIHMQNSMEILDEFQHANFWSTFGKLSMHSCMVFLSDHISAKFLHAEFSRVDILGQ